MTREAAGLNALALSVVNLMVGLSLWVPVLPTITEKVKFAAPIAWCIFFWLLLWVHTQLPSMPARLLLHRRPGRRGIYLGP